MIIFSTHCSIYFWYSLLFFCTSAWFDLDVGIKKLSVSQQSLLQDVTVLYRAERGHCHQGTLLL